MLSINNALLCRCYAYDTINYSMIRIVCLLQMKMMTNIVNCCKYAACSLLNIDTYRTHFGAYRTHLGAFYNDDQQHIEYTYRTHLVRSITMLCVDTYRTHFGAFYNNVQHG